MPNQLLTRDLKPVERPVTTPRLATDHGKLSGIIGSFAPEFQYDNIYNLRYNLYHNKNDFRTLLTNRMTDARLDGEDEITPELRDNVRKGYDQYIQDVLIQTSYTGKDYNDAVFDRVSELYEIPQLDFRVSDLQSIVAIRPEYNELLKRDQRTGQKYIAYDDNTQLSAKIASDPDLQRRVLYDQFNMFKKHAEKRFPEIHPEFHRDMFTQMFLLYSRYGQRTVQDFYDYHIEQDEDAANRIPQIARAKERLTKLKDSDNLTPIQFLQLFYGREGSEVGVFEMPEIIGPTDDLKYEIPKDMNDGFTRFFYRHEKQVDDRSQVDMYSGVIDMLKAHGRGEDDSLIQRLQKSRNATAKEWEAFHREERERTQRTRDDQVREQPPERITRDTADIAVTRPLDNRPGKENLIEYNHPEVWIALRDAVEAGSLPVEDLMQTVITNAQEHYIYGEREGRSVDELSQAGINLSNPSVFVLDMERLPDHAALAAEVLKLIQPGLFSVNELGQYVIEPGAPERRNQVFNKERSFLSTREVQVPQYDRWGNLRKVDTETVNRWTAPLALATMSGMQSVSGIIQNFGDRVAGTLQSDGSETGGNRLVDWWNWRQSRPMATSGLSRRDFVSYYITEQAEDGWDMAGSMIGAMGGYMFASLMVGKGIMGGAARGVRGVNSMRGFPVTGTIKQTQTQMLGGVNSSLQGARKAKNVSNASTILKESRDIGTMATAALQRMNANPAWSMPKFSLGYAVTELGTGQNPEWSMFGSGVMDMGVQYITEQLNRPLNTDVNAPEFLQNLQMKYLAADGTVRYGYDFIGGELLGVLFDGFHGLARYGIGRARGPARLKGLDFDYNIGRFEQATDVRYMPFPSWQRAYRDASTIVREGAANVEVGQLGAAMAKRAGRGFFEPFKPETKAEVIVETLEESGMFFRNMDSEIQDNIRHYDRLYGAEPRSEEHMLRSVEAVKRDFFEELGNHIVTMVGREDAMVFADLARGYNPRNLVRTGTGRTVISEAELRRHILGDPDNNYVIRRVDDGPNGERRFEAYQMENADWTTDLSSGIYRALSGGKTLDQAIDDALRANKIDPGDVPTAEAEEIIQQVTNTFGRQVDMPVIDTRLLPEGMRPRHNLVETGQSQRWGYRRGSIQGIDENGRYLVVDQSGNTRPVRLAGVDELSSRPLDEQAYRAFRATMHNTDVDPYTGFMRGDKVQLTKNGKNLLGDHGSEILDINIHRDGVNYARIQSPDGRAIAGYPDNLVPTNELRMVSEPVPDPVSYQNMTPAVREPLQQSSERMLRGLSVDDQTRQSIRNELEAHPEVYGSTPGGSAQVAILRTMGYSNADIDNLLVRAAPMSEVDPEDLMKRALRASIEQGTEADLATVTLTMREQGVPNSRIRDWIDEYYAGLIDDASARLEVDLMDAGARPNAGVINTAQSEILDIQRRRARAMKVANDTIENDGRVAYDTNVQRNESAAIKQREAVIDKQASTAKQTKENTRVQQADRATDTEVTPPKQQSIAKSADYQTFGIATRFKQFLDTINNKQFSTTKILSVMRKIGGGQLTDYDRLQLKKYAEPRRKSGKPVIEYFDPEKGDVPANTIVKKKRGDGTGDDYYIRTQKKFNKGDDREPRFFQKVIRDSDELDEVHINEHWRPINQSAVLDESGMPRGFVRVNQQTLDNQFGLNSFRSDDLVVRPVIDDEVPEFFVNVQRPVRGTHMARTNTDGLVDGDFMTRHDIDAIEYRMENSSVPHYKLASKHQIVDANKFDAELDMSVVYRGLDNYMDDTAKRMMGYGAGIGILGAAANATIDLDDDHQTISQAGLGPIAMIAMGMGKVGAGASRIRGRMGNAARNSKGKTSTAKTWKQANEKTIEIDGNLMKIRDLQSQGVYVPRVDDKNAIQTGYGLLEQIKAGLRSGKNAINSVLESSYVQSDQMFMRRSGSPTMKKLGEIFQKVRNEPRQLQMDTTVRFDNKHGTGAFVRFIEREMYESAQKLLKIDDFQISKEITDNAAVIMLGSKKRVENGRLVLTEMDEASQLAMNRSPQITRAVQILSGDEKFIDAINAFDQDLFMAVKRKRDELYRMQIEETLGPNGKRLGMADDHYKIAENVKLPDGTMNTEEVIVTRAQYVQAVDAFLGQNTLTLKKFAKDYAHENPWVAEALRRGYTHDNAFRRVVTIRNAENSFTDLSGRYVPHMVDYEKMKAEKLRFIGKQKEAGLTDREAGALWDAKMEKEFFEVNEKGLFRNRTLKTMDDEGLREFSSKKVATAGKKMRQIIEGLPDDIRRQIADRVGDMSDGALERAGFIIKKVQTVPKKGGGTKDDVTYFIRQPEDMQLQRQVGQETVPYNIFTNDHREISRDQWKMAAFDNQIRKSRFIERPREYDMPIPWRVNSLQSIYNIYTRDVGQRLHYIRNNIFDDVDLQRNYINPIEEELRGVYRKQGLTEEALSNKIDTKTARIRTTFDQLNGVIQATKAHKEGSTEAYNAFVNHQKRGTLFNTMQRLMYTFSGYGFSFMDTWQPWITSAVYTNYRQVAELYKKGTIDKEFIQEAERFATSFGLAGNQVDNYVSELDRFRDPTSVHGSLRDKLNYFATKSSDFTMRFSMTRAMSKAFGADVGNWGNARYASEGLIGLNSLNTTYNMLAFMGNADMYARMARRLERSGEVSIRHQGEVYTMQRIRRELERLGMTNDDETFRTFVDGQELLRNEWSKFGSGQSPQLRNLDPRHQEIVRDILSTSAETYHGINMMNYAQKWGTPQGRLLTTFLRFGYNISLQTIQKRMRVPMQEWFDTFSGQRGNPELNRLQAGEIFYHYDRQDWAALRAMGLSDEAMQAFPAEAFGTAYRTLMANGINVAGFTTLGILKDFVSLPFADYSGNERFYSLILNPYAPKEDQVSLLDLFQGDFDSAADYVALSRWFMGKSGLYMGVAGGYFESATGWGVSRMRVADFAPPAVGIYTRIADDALGYIRSDYSDFTEWGLPKFTNDMMSVTPVFGSRMVPRSVFRDAMQEALKNE